jgi:hypothetical protein
VPPSPEVLREAVAAFYAELDRVAAQDARERRLFFRFLALLAISVCVLMVIVRCEAAADDRPRLWVNAGGLSWHAHAAAPSGERFRSLNPGLGVEWQLSDAFAVGAGGLVNSLGRSSFYAGARWTPLALPIAGGALGEVRAGATLLAVSGYEPLLARVVVAPVPTLTWDGERTGLQLLVAPPAGRWLSGWVVALQWRARWM